MSNIPPCSVNNTLVLQNTNCNGTLFASLSCKTQQKSLATHCNLYTQREEQVAFKISL